MAVDKLVDSSKLDACCLAEANAIRAKTGDSSSLTYDWANSKGFADAIAAISGGGGSIPHVYAVDYTPLVNTQSISIPLPFTVAPIVVSIYIDANEKPSAPPVPAVSDIRVAYMEVASQTSWTISTRRTHNVKTNGSMDSWSSTPEGSVSNELISMDVSNKGLYFLEGLTYHIIAVESVYVG